MAARDQLRIGPWPVSRCRRRVANRRFPPNHRAPEAIRPAVPFPSCPFPLHCWFRPASRVASRQCPTPNGPETSTTSCIERPRNVASHPCREYLFILRVMEAYMCLTGSVASPYTAAAIRRPNRVAGAE